MPSSSLFKSFSIFPSTRGIFHGKRIPLFHFSTSPLRGVENGKTPHAGISPWGSAYAVPPGKPTPGGDLESWTARASCLVTTECRNNHNYDQHCF